MKARSTRTIGSASLPYFAAKADVRLDEQNKITVVRRDGVVAAHAAITDGFVRVTPFVWASAEASLAPAYNMDDTRGGGQLHLGDEGVTWIQGWHAADSDEAQALLAAHALAKLARDQAKVDAYATRYGGLGRRG